MKKLKEFNSCCCRYHVEMLEIKEGLLNMRMKGLHMRSQSAGSSGCPCRCLEVCGGESADGCGSLTEAFKGVTKLWLSTLSPLNDIQEWHALRCLRDDCNLCGVKLLSFCPCELDLSSEYLVPWRKFEKVFAGQTRDGVTKEVTRLECKLTPAIEFIDFARSKLPDFIMHNFVSKWQERQFRLCKDSLAEDTILSIVDFAENYTFTVQNEI